MKIILKYVCVCLLFSACASVPISEQNKSFVVFHTKDTIFGKKIRFSRGIGEIGNVKVVNASGDKQFFPYDKVYQVHHYRKRNNFYVEEMVMLTPNNPISYTPMDIISNKGNIKLYEHDPTNWGNTPFVTSAIFYGYVRTTKDVDKLLIALNKCAAFQEKFSQKSQRQNILLAELIEFYNENCE